MDEVDDHHGQNDDVWLMLNGTCTWRMMGCNQKWETHGNGSNNMEGFDAVCHDDYGGATSGVAGDDWVNNNVDCNNDDADNDDWTTTIGYMPTMARYEMDGIDATRYIANDAVPWSRYRRRRR